MFLSLVGSSHCRWRRSRCTRYPPGSDERTAGLNKRHSLELAIPSVLGLNLLIKGKCMQYLLHCSPTKNGSDSPIYFIPREFNFLTLGGRAGSEYCIRGRVCGSWNLLSLLSFRNGFIVSHVFSRMLSWIILSSKLLRHTSLAHCTECAWEEWGSKILRK